MEQSFIQVRVDNRLKQDALDVLNEIGLDMPNAIRMFLKRVVLEKGLPFDAKLPGELTDGDLGNMDIMVQTIPAKPSLHISEEEYLALLCSVPEGKVTRYDDIVKHLKCRYGVERITIDHKPIGYRPDIPFWRELSTRGMLQNLPLHCTREQQKEKLEKEGLRIVPCGAYQKSLKVENYRDYLYDFGQVGTFGLGEKQDG